MSKYDDQYYIANYPKGDGQIKAAPDYQTGSRGYDYEKVPLGGPPFSFLNINKDKDKRKGVSWQVTENMMVLTDLLVGVALKDKIKQYPINGLQLYPSIYVDDDGNIHDKFWFLNFYESLDCWSRKDSKLLNWRRYYNDEDEGEEEEDPVIVKFSLDEKKLDAIPEENRMLFKMGNSGIAYIFVHKKIVDYALNISTQGIRFVKVSDFREGEQH